MKLSALSVALLSIGLSSFSVAQTMESMLVTGSRLDMQHLAPQSTLSRDDIDRLNPATTVDLMRHIPHLLISQNGAAGGQSFVSIRGGESNFTLIMIDHVVVNDPTNSRGGGFDFNLLDPATLERVEVYRGGVSAVYGGEAVSGVIHFITRQSDYRGLTLETGSDSQKRASLSLASPLGNDISTLFNAAYSSQNANDFSDYENQQFLFKLMGQNENSDYQLLLSHSQQDSSAFPEDSGGQRFATIRQPESRDGEQFLAGVQGNWHADDNLKLSAKLSWSRHQEDAESPGIAEAVLSGIPASTISSDYRQTEGQLFATFAPDNAWHWVAGMEGQKSIGENNGFLDFGFPLPVDFKLEQEVYSLFTQASREYNALALELGLRWDSPTQFDNELSSRVQAGYRFSEDFRLFGGFAEGYKLPSFFALAHPLIGNPALQPEKSSNKEIGFSWTLSSQSSTQLVAFHNDFEDLVDFDPELFTSVNRAKVRTQGVEWQIQGNIAAWLNAQLDISYLDVDAGETKLRRRPHWNAGFALQASFDALQISLTADSRSEFLDSAIPTGSLTLGGYTELALAGSWQWSEDLAFTLAIDNLLDKAYEQSIGFNETGRQWRLGLRYTL
ncbi:TonB-dependent receptor [Aliiglaciecola sp. CAU 1673]|uniref:TonB-dependent receptor plug domain-containing protein n=1 Tax=Aliiglaciecola sp. CAU 1673 TaxID=3032595 RepID=UPI0023DC295C|nr:TonB-dependent receptor [Aliiglaciecola sp. CAU 1673]MDF2177310.1 TonB-dependent receptor [Aliiglaciecola sp. CAU 1673]